MAIYDYTFKDGKGNDLSMKDYQGKVLLIVNSATGCGFTPQYEGIEKLYETYHDRGLEVLDFPCNQFGNQAPESDEEIHQFCSFKYKTQFPQMKKIDVNGPDALPLFDFLKSQKGFAGFSGEKAAFMEDWIAKQDPDFKNNANIKWNFTKFLVDRNGNVIERFESTTEPEEIAKKVEELL